MMSSLSTFALVIFAFTPLVVVTMTIGLLACIMWLRLRGGGSPSDGPCRLLETAVRRMPDERREWGTAMLAELDHVHGRSERWRFALGCAKVALFPPGKLESLPLTMIKSTLPILGAVALVSSALLQPAQASINSRLPKKSLL